MKKLIFVTLFFSGCATTPIYIHDYCDIAKPIKNYDDMCDDHVLEQIDRENAKYYDLCIDPGLKSK